ncbi:MAG: CCA tRNA nucleotidyltransferase [Ferrovibrio sp.]|uniref:CCA tRNA nucleotidyltransferase n=1 Tax=Ferrovibrio sp. TaxID=1917215 RepID=UPI002636FC0F|nr:CCA tRNA nucleotidyltransferase [Ferrovibrio sp.]MCW0236619.1 CCA tRNA nucleotidyltransferase [Ferrovibrio sp.]
MTLPDRIPPVDWMTAAPTRSLLAALGAGGAPVRFVGGCVRDAILGLRPADIDIATPETPETVIRRLEKAKLKVVPTGIEHGTVTAVVPPATFQVTTLRRDVATDGRRATVAFGTDWAEDAARRDFTINALYADADGRLYDYTDGRADLAAGRVRFIGDPATRVVEDYLRVLRFFRFHARFGKGAPDAAALAACAAAADRLDRLSGERIRDEVLKILALPNAADALVLMQQSGVLAAVLPAARFDAGAFARLVTLQEAVAAGGGSDPDVWPRLTLLLDQAGIPAEVIAERLRLSNAQRLRLEGLLALPVIDSGILQDESAFRLALYRLSAERFRNGILIAASRQAVDHDLAVARAIATATWQRPVFPLRGADVIAAGFSPGPTVSALLGELESWWVEAGFAPDREACLQRLRDRVQLTPDD